MTASFFDASLLDGAGRNETFDLLQVVDVVAGHGFYDGPEGHGAALGVGGGAVAVVLRDGGEEEEVPVAGGLEESETGFELVGCVAFGPGFLIEGLDDGVGLVERGGESLAEAEREDHFAVGQVSDNVADAPFAWGWWSVDLGAVQGGGECLDALGGGGEDGDRVLAVQEAGVRV
jgi:hypothetical protein